jgi:hypothetical protein
LEEIKKFIKELLKTKSPEEVIEMIQGEKERFGLSDKEVKSLINYIKRQKIERPTEEKSEEKKEEIERLIKEFFEKHKEELRGPKGEKGDKGDRGPPGPPGKVPKWISVMVAIAFIISILAIAFGFISWRLQPQISTTTSIVSFIPTTQISQVTKVTTLTVPLTITTVQEFTRTAKETVTITTTATKVVTSTQTIEDIRLRELLERINNTTFENVDRYVRSVAHGWSAEQMAQNLSSRFWIETKILTKDNVQYLFLRFKCNCCPTAEWWWVTYQGLKPANLAPVHP